MLDNTANQASILGMKGSSLFLLILSLAAQRCFAQETNAATSPPTNSSALHSDISASSASAREHSAASSDRFIKKMAPLSAGRRIVEVPRRVLHLINPFAPSEAKEGFENLRDLNPRAWTTTVGWHPGTPPFQDAVTHESSLSLIDLNRSRELR